MLSPIFANAPQTIQGVRPRVPAMAGGLRLRDNSNYQTGTSGVNTTHFKLEAEAPFLAVRVWVADKNTTGPGPTYAALVAASETGAADTVSNAFLPIAGGVAYNNLVGTGAYGWRAVTWNAAASVTLGAAASTNAASVAVSDWIPCSSLPRVDVPGGRPMALLRLAQQNASGKFTQGGNAMDGWLVGKTENAAFYRFQTNANAANDGVATLTNLPANLPTVSGRIGYEKYAWLEFLYAAPTRSVLVTGDSRDSSAYNTYGTSWVVQALQGKSTQAAPITVSNFAGSGHSQIEFLALLNGAIDAGMSVTDVVVPGFSQNGFAANHGGAEAFLGRLAILLRKLSAAGVRVWMTTDYACYGYTGDGEAARQMCIAAVKSWGASGLVTVIDTDALISDYSNPAAPIMAAAYDSGDHVHANPAGQALMAQALAAAWV